MFYYTKVLIFSSVLSVFAIASPYQELPPKPGYVPVYIREGNMPLSLVHPALVEAFHENEETSQTRKETNLPQQVEKAISEEINLAPRTNGQTKGLNDYEVSNKELTASPKQVGKQECENPTSEIAQFI